MGRCPLLLKKKKNRIQKYFRLSNDYIKAYEILEKQLPCNFNVQKPQDSKFPLQEVKYYLLGFSLEIGLKSYLLSRNVSFCRTHDLKELLRKAKEALLFQTTPNLMERILREKAVAKFNKIYNSHYIRYLDMADIKENPEGSIIKNGKIMPCEEYYVDIPNGLFKKFDSVLKEIKNQLTQNFYI